MVENFHANARDMGSSPGLGRSHMPRSDYAREPQLLSLRVWSLCSATGEATMVRGLHTGMKSGPHLPQLEKALAQKRRPNTAIHTYIHTYIHQSINQSIRHFSKEDTQMASMEKFLISHQGNANQKTTMRCQCTLQDGYLKKKKRTCET